MKEEDRNKRLESRELTRLRRQSQDCKCYTLKIDESHLNSVQRNFLHMSFLEAKWFYNYALSQTNIFDSSIRKVKNALSEIKDGIPTFNSNEGELLGCKDEKCKFPNSGVDTIFPESIFTCPVCGIR